MENEIQDDDNIFKILIATDNHLGYGETKPNIGNNLKDSCSCNKNRIFQHKIRLELLKRYYNLLLKMKWI